MCRYRFPVDIVNLSWFQSLFDDLWTKFGTYSAGESLFGMPSTDFACLHKVKKELNLLQKLYTLYDAVMVSINGYYDVLWAELEIEKINTELLEFQARYVDLFYYVSLRVFRLAACNKLILSFKAVDAKGSDIVARCGIQQKYKGYHEDFPTTLSRAATSLSRRTPPLVVSLGLAIFFVNIMYVCIRYCEHSNLSIIFFRVVLL